MDIVSSEDASYGGGTLSTRRSSLESGGESNMANSLSIPSQTQLTQMFSGGRLTSDGDPAAFRGSNPTSPVVTTSYRIPSLSKAVTLTTGGGFVSAMPPVSPDATVPASPPQISPTPPESPSFFEEYKTPIVAGGVLLLALTGYMIYKANG